MAARFEETAFTFKKYITQLLRKVHGAVLFILSGSLKVQFRQMTHTRVRMTWYSRWSCSFNCRQSTGHDYIASTSSAQCDARYLEMSYCTGREKVQNIIHYYPYKIRRVQESLQIAKISKWLFDLTFLDIIGANNTWPMKILGGDEFHFYFNRCLNIQNSRI